MLKIFKDFFGDKLNNNKGDYKNNDTIDTVELKEILENIFSKIDWILLIEKKHCSERDTCECDINSFEELKNKINENWLSIEFCAGEYIVSKNIKNTKWSVSKILKRFVHKIK